MDVEPHGLQEAIAEAHEEVEELRKEERGNAWVRYVGLSAAIFAVVAAIAALRSGALINEAMIAQIKAADTWAEYQASREKEHIYTVGLDALVDRGSKNLNVWASIARRSQKRLRRRSRSPGGREA